ncbi:hypothetical protein P7K49_022629 [Saguinus oedipus]|uniref:Uncharacterized protein n=1 Tax=Saguinus oedipus TaxID=9490 RepID=A0ABQ9UK52_SAGOE|nr:hypothetical protein P7K49_022629 [Saguinus oedipus]
MRGLPADAPWRGHFVKEPSAGRGHRQAAVGAGAASLEVQRPPTDQPYLSLRGKEKALLGMAFGCEQPGVAAVLRLKVRSLTQLSPLLCDGHVMGHAWQLSPPVLGTGLTACPKGQPGLAPELAKGILSPQPLAATKRSCLYFQPLHLMAWPIPAKASGYGVWEEGLSGPLPDTAQASNMVLELPFTAQQVGSEVLADPELLGGLFPHSTVFGCPAPGLRSLSSRDGVLSLGPSPGLEHGGPQDTLCKCTQLHGRHGSLVHKAWMPEDGTLCLPLPSLGLLPQTLGFPVKLSCSEAVRSEGRVAC